MNKFKKLLIVVMLFLCTNTTKAQTSDTLEIKRNEKGKIEFVRFKPNDTRKLKDGTAFLKSVLVAKADDDFSLIRETTDKFGITHRRFQQYYKNIKVDGAVYILHGKNGNIETINGHFQDVETATNPSLSEAQALKKALAFMNAKKYNWEDTSLEKIIKQNTNDPNATYYPKGELLIAKDYLNGTKKYKLSWVFTISSIQPNKVQMIYVDAVTGEVISSKSLIEDTNVPCSTETIYSGSPLVTGDLFSGGYRLREITGGVSVQTLNLQHNTYTGGGNAIDFVNSNTNWTSTNWSTFSSNQAALDAHWGAERVLDYWSTYHSRNSIDGSGITLLGYVHYGTNVVNSFWQGGTGNHYVLYGDGNGSNIHPLTSLDICAHEFGHGINEFTANTSQSSSGIDEADALNEGLSDIWAAAIEDKESTHHDPNNIWKIGEDVFSSGYTCFRDMKNPKGTSAQQGQHPNTYQGDYWDNYGEPHTNSAVLSYWFYLVSEGKNDVNDIGNAYSVTGITIDEAADIVYQAETNYLAPQDGYTNARTATIQAAIDLYGSGSCEVISVTNAWYAVGVGDAYSTISGSSTLCSGTSGSYSINNLPSGATVVWSASPSGTVTINSPTSTSTTLTKSGGGNITLMATITYSCGTYVVYFGPITVGTPAAADIVGMDPSTYFSAGQTVYLSVNETASGYSWDIYGGTVSGSSTAQTITVVLDDCFPNQSENNDFDANVTLTNGGCTSANYHEHTYATCDQGPGGFTISPNPTVDGYINLSIGSVKKSSGKKVSNRVVIKLYDVITNNIIRQWSFVGEQKNYSLKTDGFRKGHYIIEVLRGADKQSKHILIE